MKRTTHTSLKDKRITSLPTGFLLLLLLSLLSGGCATGLRCFEGPQQPQTEVAILEVSRHPITCATIDGREVGRFVAHITMLPGKHTASFRLNRPDAVSRLATGYRVGTTSTSKPVELSFAAVAGHRYKLQCLEYATDGKSVYQTKTYTDVLARYSREGVNNCILPPTNKMEVEIEALNVSLNKPSDLIEGNTFQRVRVPVEDFVYSTTRCWMPYLVDAQTGKMLPDGSLTWDTGRQIVPCVSDPRDPES